MIRMEEKMEFFESFQRPNGSGYAVIGAGLPRTGTMSTRHPLGILLGGKCHHMLESVSTPFSFYMGQLIRESRQNFEIMRDKAN